MGFGSIIKAVLSLGRRAIGVKLEEERFNQTVGEVRKNADWRYCFLCFYKKNKNIWIYLHFLTVLPVENLHQIIIIGAGFWERFFYEVNYLFPVTWSTGV